MGLAGCGKFREVRPRTKGETVGVQLPLAVDRWVRSEAAAVGLSPGLWLARLVRVEFNRVVREREAALAAGHPRPLMEVLAEDLEVGRVAGVSSD